MQDQTKDHQYYKDLNDSCFALMLKKSDRYVSAFFNDHLKNYGIRITQFSVLIHLATSDTVSLNGLSRRLSMERSTITRGLRALVRDGYATITVEVDRGDRRKKAVAITTEGLRLINKAVRGWEEAQDIVKQSFTEKEIKELREYLSNLYDKLIVHRG